MTLTTFDMIIVAIIFLSSAIACYKGFIKFSISFITFLTSILTSYLLYPIVLGFFEKYFSNEVGLVILSGTISYLISLIFFSFVSSKLKEMVNGVSGGFVDRILGLLAGFIRGSVVSIILFVVVAVFSSGSYIVAKTAQDIVVETTRDKYPVWLKESLTMESLDKSSRSILMMIDTKTLSSITLEKSAIIDEDDL